MRRQVNGLSLLCCVPYVGNLLCCLCGDLYSFSLFLCVIFVDGRFWLLHIIIGDLVKSLFEAYADIIFVEEEEDIFGIEDGI